MSIGRILGDENFFIEVQEHGIAEQRRLHPQLVELARGMNIPLLATNDTHYTQPEQHEAHDLLLCIQTGSNLDTPGRMRFETNEFYLKPAAEMRSPVPWRASRRDRQHAAHRGAVRPEPRLRAPAPAALRRADGETEAPGCVRSASAGWRTDTAPMTDESAIASTTSSGSSTGWATARTS